MSLISLHLILMLLTTLIAPAKPDPDLLTDFCVADATKATSVFLNGVPCIDPATAVTAHFATSALSKPGDTAANLFGFNVTATNMNSLPGANAQGLTMARVDIAAAGIVPLHLHPRASEVALLLKGTLLVGFVDTGNKLFTQQLRPGDAFVFPKGMLHFLYNLDPVTPALALSGLSSQNPGVQVLALAGFRSQPRIPEEVLKKTFQVSGQDIQRIQKNLGG